MFYIIFPYLHKFILLVKKKNNNNLDDNNRKEEDERGKNSYTVFAMQKFL